MTARLLERPLRSMIPAMVALAMSAATWMAPEEALGRGEVIDLPALLDEWVDERGGPEPLLAIRPPYIFTHNVGLLQLQITNVGMIGNFFQDIFSAGWRGGEYLYAAGLWVGAKRSDGVPLVSTAVYELEFQPPIEPEWTVREAFEGITGGNRLGFSSGPQDEVVPGSGVGDIRTTGANDDWDNGRDMQVDEDFLNGFDDDLDGIVDEDFEAIGQQMFASQYWDISEFTQQEYPDHEPLDLLVQQRSFAWATSGANEFVGFDFKVWNIGNETLNDVFIAFFVDGDAGPRDTDGYWVDDKGGFVAIDTTVVDDTIVGPCRQRGVNIDITYIFDTPDAEINEEQGGVRGGDVPGYFGGMFLGHTTDPLGINAPQNVGIRRARFFSGSEPYPDGDPRNDVERYDLISGTGTPIRETIKPADYRYCISAGPFKTLPPDTFLTFQTAFVIGDGRQGMVTNAVQAQLIFDGAWRNADESDETGVGGKETCLRPVRDDAGIIQWDNPCDTASVTVPFDWPGYCAPDVYVDNDCDPCTPLEEGGETLVNWVGTVAPPPPNMNTDGLSVAQAPEGNREVILKWDNLSELKADPIQRRILFEGYRIWRVEGWRRPVGSTGPAPEEWQLIGEYVLNPDGPTSQCFVPHPEIGGDRVALEFHVGSKLGNWHPVEEPMVADLDGDGSPDWPLNDVEALLPANPCEACPDFCWPQRPFLVDEDAELLEEGIATGDTTPGNQTRDLYEVGLYTYVDREGIKNGMVYFYDVTAFSAWCDPCEGGGARHFELASRPAAREEQRVVPTWPAQDTKNEIYVVPNPYVQGDRNVLPWGWDQVPSDSDPTGTRLAFANLPMGQNVIKVYTLAGDLVESIDHFAAGANGTAFWNLVSRNGQDIVAGVYLYTVKTENQGTQVGRFTVIR